VFGNVDDGFKGYLQKSGGEALHVAVSWSPSIWQCLGILWVSSVLEHFGLCGMREIHPWGCVLQAQSFFLLLESTPLGKINILTGPKAHRTAIRYVSILNSKPTNTIKPTIHYQ